MRSFFKLRFQSLFYVFLHFVSYLYKNILTLPQYKNLFSQVAILLLWLYLERLEKNGLPEASKC